MGRGFHFSPAPAAVLPRLEVCSFCRNGCSLPWLSSEESRVHTAGLLFGSAPVSISDAQGDGVTLGVASSCRLTTGG